MFRICRVEVVGWQQKLSQIEVRVHPWDVAATDLMPDIRAPINLKYQMLFMAIYVRIDPSCGCQLSMSIFAREPAARVLRFLAEGGEEGCGVERPGMSSGEGSVAM